MRSIEQIGEVFSFLIIPKQVGGSNIFIQKCSPICMKEIQEKQGKKHKCEHVLP